VRAKSTESPKAVMPLRRNCSRRGHLAKAPHTVVRITMCDELYRFRGGMAREGVAARRKGGATYIKIH
jgi:hypothetical protein